MPNHVNQPAQFAGDMLNLISNTLGDTYLEPDLAAAPNDHRVLPAALELVIQRLLTDRATAEATTTELRAERDRAINETKTWINLARTQQAELDHTAECCGSCPNRQ